MTPAAATLNANSSNVDAAFVVMQIARPSPR